MEFDKRVKEQLLNRGFTEEQLLNNRGLIGATINETVVMLVKKLPIQRVVNPVVCDNPLHNTQVEADGRCHWCEGKELI